MTRIMELDANGAEQRIVYDPSEMTEEQALSALADATCAAFDEAWEEATETSEPTEEQA